MTCAVNDKLPIPVSHARHEVTTSLGAITLALTTLRSVGAPDAVGAQVAELLASAEGPARLLQEGRGLAGDLEELQRLADTAPALVAEVAG